MRSTLLIAVLMLFAPPLPAQSAPAELDGWPVIELTRAFRPNGEIWVGTYGHGVLVHPAGHGAWRRIRSDSNKNSLSWDFVHAIAFGPKDEVWVGTIGNGWGLSRDDGHAWRNWTYSDLGPEWQYVAPDGIVTIGDTTVIATADGLQVTTDDGEHWVAIVDSTGPAARGPADRAVVALGNEYVLSLTGPNPQSRGWVTVKTLPRRPDAGMVRLNIAELLSGNVTAGAKEYAAVGYSPAPPSPERERHLKQLADSLRAIMPTWKPKFGRPIGTDGNQYIDQTYRWGSTMGGNFQPHQGVEFNNPDGTPVHAIGDGVVEWSGPAEAGALTVAIRHAPMQMPDGSSRYIYSVYYHNSALLAQVGDTVHRGDVISRVGNTGRATNDHMHLEVHASPFDSVGLIVDPDVRYPPYVTNPELWIEPMPGTGLIAGRVVDASGNPVPQTRIYGIRKPLPRETPLAFVETYGPRNKPSPMYGENFAISDVPAGVYHLKAKVGDGWVERSVTVAPGVMSWVELRP